jgi:hypothetical protein
MLRLVADSLGLIPQPPTDDAWEHYEPNLSQIIEYGLRRVHDEIDELHVDFNDPKLFYIARRVHVMIELIRQRAAPWENETAEVPK